MKCAIYTPEELRRFRKAARGGVLVLASAGGRLILKRDEINALWVLPEGALQPGEDELESARRVLGEAIGEAVFEVRPLCAYAYEAAEGGERAGRAYVAEVREWPGEGESAARAFEQMPLPSQMDKPALVFALHRWAGEAFDERLTIERLGDPGAL